MDRLVIFLHALYPLHMTAGIRGWSALALLFPFLSGCRDQPPPSVGDLRFPVVVIYGTSSAVLFQNPQALSSARIADLNAVTEPPPLIDSDFKIHILQGLSSTHSSLWLMAHPTGSTPVRFRLERATDSGIEAARALMKSRLDVQTWRNDLHKQREAIDRATTLDEMFSIISPESPGH
jgi:hypothetical protein